VGTSIAGIRLGLLIESSAGNTIILFYSSLAIGSLLFLAYRGILPSIGRYS
jgi:hypothetical protein